MRRGRVIGTFEWSVKGVGSLLLLVSDCSLGEACDRRSLCLCCIIYCVIFERSVVYGVCFIIQCVKFEKRSFVYYVTTFYYYYRPHWCLRISDGR